MEAKQKKTIFFALLAAVLYAINSPVSKLLLNNIPAKMMAAFLYLGAGLSLLIFRQMPSLTFIIALVIMAVGTYFASTEEA